MTSRMRVLCGLLIIWPTTNVGALETIARVTQDSELVSSPSNYDPFISAGQFGSRFNGSHRPDLAAAFHRVNERLFSYWFSRLASRDAQIRKEAKKVLMEDDDYERLLQTANFDPRSLDSHREFRRIYCDLKSILPQLIALLDCPDEETVLLAGHAIACIGPEAETAVAKLMEKIQSRTRSEAITESLVSTLMFVYPRDQPIGPFLWQAVEAECVRTYLNDRATGTRHDYDVESGNISAVLVLKVLIESGRTTIEVPTLIRIAQTTNIPRALRFTMLATLAELGADARTALPGLRQLLKDDDPEIRENAGATLLAIQGNQDELPSILDQLSAGERVRFMQGIDRFHRQDAERWAAYREFFKDNDRELSSLIEEIKYGRPFQQRQAIRSLTHLATLAKRAVPELVVALHSHDAYTREAAFVALRQIDPNAIPTPSLQHGSCGVNACSMCSPRKPLKCRSNRRTGCRKR